MSSPPPPARWFPTAGATASQSPATERNFRGQDAFDIRQFLLDQRRQKELDRGIGIEEEMTENLGREVSRS